MAEQKVELRKVRGFGDNLNDTILFIRQNFKPLLSSFLGIAGIFMLATAILTNIYQGQIGDIVQDIFNQRRPNSISIYKIFSENYLLLIFSWLNFVAIEVAIISYIKVYEIKEGEAPVISEVWEVFRRYYFKVFFFLIPVSLLIIFGCMFCLLPGIYLAVVFVPFSSILVIEDQSFGEAFNRCFRLIKDNFWISLLIYVLTYLISFFSGGIISLIVEGASGLFSNFTTGRVTETNGIVSSILDIFSFIFYIFYYVSVTLHYFNLAEKHDGTGMMKKLDSIGGSGQNFDNIQEQY